MTAAQQWALIVGVGVSVLLAALTLGWLGGSIVLDPMECHARGGLWARGWCTK